MFNELKQKCLAVWKKYEDRPWGYYEEKVEYVNRINNPKDYYILINMFDLRNQKELYKLLSSECREYYKDYFKCMLENYEILGGLD